MFAMSNSYKSLALCGASVGVLLLAAPAMAQPVQLGPVTVQDKADRNALNHAPPVAAMPSTSLQDTPQAVTVIDSATMKQQATSSLSEALRNAPGITIAIGEGGTLAGDQFKIRGFDAGLAQLLTRYILGDGAKYQFAQVTSSTREQVLINDQVDMVLATYSITPARAEKISFAGPYYTSQAGVLVKANNKTIQSYNDLAGKKVATQAGSTGPAILAQYAPKSVVQEFQTHQEALDALRQGRVDAYVTDYTLLLNVLSLGTGDAKLAGAPFGAKDPYGIGLPKGSDGVAFINAFLKKLEADGTWAKLWTISIGQRIGSTAAPTPPSLP